MAELARPPKLAAHERMPSAPPTSLRRPSWDAREVRRVVNRAGSILCPVILGRDDLLGLIDDLIAEALRSRGRTLLLSGQAGLGKTRLIRAALRKAEASGLRVDG